MTTLREHPHAVLVRERFAALNAGDVAPFYEAVRRFWAGVTPPASAPAWDGVPEPVV